MCDPKKFAARYIDVFTERLGVPAANDEDDDIVLRVNDQIVFCVMNTAPRDPDVLRFYASFGTDVPQLTLDAAIGKVNRRVVGPKLFTTGDGTFVAEAQIVVAGRNCLPTADHLAAVLPRVISMTLFALDELRTELTLHGIAQATENAA